MRRRRVLILGAAGRDFHNFNVYFKDNERYEVVGFTATQIPKIHGRRYPAALSGWLYPDGVRIYKEGEMDTLIADHQIDEVVMSYSDVSYQTMMQLGSRALAAGADYRLLNPDVTMLASEKPVIAACAVRTGCGKSQTSRYVSRVLRELGIRAVVIRHPMPYGDLSRQSVQRFATYDDLTAHNCTIEEREEYEAHLKLGNVVYAGIDYHAILAQAQQEADIIIWDGGNNDLPFVQPDLWITVADPLRPGHELRYYPGEVNFRRANVILINKANTADKAVVDDLADRARRINPGVTVVIGASVVAVDKPSEVAGKRVLLVEDGPTLTHGEMPYGAGKVAAEKYGAAEIIDPRPYAVGTIKECYARYPSTGDLIPAMGYYPEQIRDLEETIDRADCDLVLIATPIELGRLIDINKRAVQVRYELEDMGDVTLSSIVREFVAKGHIQQGERPQDRKT